MKPRGKTPISSKVEPLSVIVWPITFGSLPYRRCQNSCVSTAVRRFSAGTQDLWIPHQYRNGPVRHHQAQHTTSNRQQGILGQQLLNYPSTASTEYRSHRDFLLTTRRAREQQVGNIRARN